MYDDIFIFRISSQSVASKVPTVSSSGTRQLSSGSSARCMSSNTGGSTGRGGHLHHHLSVEELRLIQVGEISLITDLLYHPYYKFS